MIDRRSLLAALLAAPAIARAQPGIDQPRHVLRPLDVAVHPVKAVGVASQHGQSSNTQVSLVPPPWEEFTTKEPSFRATRVKPPGTIWILSDTST